MSPMVWWVIPALATIAAVIWTKLGSWSVGRVPPRPQPGSPQDRADLERFAAALAADWPGRVPTTPDLRPNSPQPEGAPADHSGRGGLGPLGAGPGSQVGQRGQAVAGDGPGAMDASGASGSRAQVPAVGGPDPDSSDIVVDVPANSRDSAGRDSARLGAS